MDGAVIGDFGSNRLNLSLIFGFLFIRGPEPTFTCHGRLWPYHGELERTALDGDIPCTGRNADFTKLFRYSSASTLPPNPAQKPIGTQTMNCDVRGDGTDHAIYQSTEWSRRTRSQVFGGRCAVNNAVKSNKEYASYLCR